MQLIFYQMQVSFWEGENIASILLAYRLSSNTNKNALSSSILKAQPYVSHNLINCKALYFACYANMKIFFICIVLNLFMEVNETVSHPTFQCAKFLY